MSFLSSIVGHPAERVAIVDQNDYYSYGEVVLQARYLAATLRDEGVAQGEPVAYLADKGVCSVVAMLGIWFADAVAMPFDIRQGPEVLHKQMSLLGGRFVVRSYHAIEDCLFQSVLNDLKWITTEIQHANPLPLKVASYENQAIIFFTGSGDDLVKPVVITFSALAARANTLARVWGVEPKDHMMHLLSMGSTFGIAGVLCAMAAGATCKLFDSNERLCERLAQDASELVVIEDSDYGDVLDAWQTVASGIKSKKSTNLVVVSSSPLLTDVEQQWCQLSGVSQIMGFGLAECGIILSMDISDQHPDIFVGKPLPGVSIRLVNESGKELVSSVGEIEVRSPQLFAGYFARGSLSTDSFDHGWYKTGVQAFKQPDGCYQLVG